MNWIGWLGIGYIGFWNIIAYLAWKISNKEDKSIKWIPVIILLVTIPPFLMGWFGNG